MGILFLLKIYQGKERNTESLEGLPAEERQKLEQTRPDASRSSLDATLPAPPSALAGTETKP